MDKVGIVLNRMYVGDYLSTNLGHEVINLFKADNGNHYVYLNSTGNFASVHKGKIGYMLFVKYHKEDEMEVIGMATELEEVVGRRGSRLDDEYCRSAYAFVVAWLEFAVAESKYIRTADLDVERLGYLEREIL